VVWEVRDNYSISSSKCVIICEAVASLYCSCCSVTDQTVVTDDKQAGAFGPGARDFKIRSLRMYPLVLVY